MHTTSRQIELNSYRSCAYEIWNNIAIPNSYLLGLEPWELSVVFNPDPSQLSFTGADFMGGPGGPMAPPFWEEALKSYTPGPLSLR